MMLQQAEKLKEEERKRNVLKLQREKYDHTKEAERQKQFLREEYRERFGKEMPEESAATDQSQSLSKMSGKDRVAWWCAHLRKLHAASNPQGLRSCLPVLRAYCANAKEHPTEAKYLSIRQENSAFKTRVLPMDGAVQLLEVVGFKDDGQGHLAVEGIPDGYLLGVALKFLDLMISQMA
eukprot:GHVT01094658.1.p2 GENE.GHVT01094658.1~~GHVT01094658.1.p2  ORF type:complete len:179 (+),score=52.39 GHVT01094658.1:894-1430(+)